jgi:ABC-type transport system involved in multi-copper enzyme maturation permease subunit
MATFNQITSNPIIRKEIMTRMRSLKTYLVVTGFIGLLSIGAVVILMTLSFASGQPGSLELWERSGKLIFYTVFLMELLLISFIAPALTASSIAAEKELQTYDLLVTTLLGGRKIVMGKLFSALAFLFILTISALPLFALSYMFGGVNLPEIIIASSIVIFVMVSYSALGLFFSSIIKRPMIATIVTYLCILVFLVGIPIFLIASLTIMIPLFGINNTSPGTVFEILAFTIGWLLVSLNPITSSALSEISFLNSNQYFHVELPLSNGTTFYLPAPWIAYILFSGILILAAVLSTIYVVNLREK